MPRHGESKEVGWLRQQLEQMTAERDRLRQHLEAREELDALLVAEALPQAADGTGPIARIPGHRAAAHRTPREQRWLRVVPGFIPVALLHPWRHLLAASPAVKTAAAVTATAGALTVGAVVVPQTGVGHYIGGALGGASVSAPGDTATPIAPPSSPPSFAASVTHLKPRLDARSARGVQSAPWYVYDPPASSGSSPSSPLSPSSQQQAPAPSGPPALTVSASSLDLTSLTSQTLTVSASGGGGWVSWKVNAGGPDLDFSPDHGVLQAGQTATVSVSIDPAQAVDGNTSQTFSIGGQQVAVSLPPLPAPAVVPTDAATVPAVPDPLAS